MNSLSVERRWPFLIGVLAGGGAAAVVFTCHFKLPPTTVPVAMMTFGIVVSGFVATQRNMLLTMGGASVLRFVANTGYYEDIVDYLRQCIFSGLFVALWSTLGFFLGSDRMLWSIWLSVQTGAVVLVLALLFRNELIVVRLVKRFIEQYKGSGPLTVEQSHVEESN